MFIVFMLAFIVFFSVGCNTVETQEKKLPVVHQSFTEESDTCEVKLWIKKLEDHRYADDAYVKLYAKGKEVIPYLIANADNKKIYPSFIHVHPLSSKISKPTVGVISLYIIESILNQELHPHFTALILEYKNVSPASVKTKPEVLEKAKTAYEIWWERNKDKPLSQIIKEDRNPLKGTVLYWY